MRVRATAVVAMAICAFGAPAVFAADPPADGMISADVSIDGVAVGGLTIDAARRAVIDQRIIPHFAPLLVSLKGRRMTIKPTAAGYAVDLDTAIETAIAYGRSVPVTAPVNVPLDQTVDRDRLRAVLTFRAPDIELAPVDALLTFRKARPVVRPARVGTLIDIAKAIPIVADALIARDVPQVELPVRRVRPAKMTVGPSVVVNRANRMLMLYRETKLVKTFRVAVGTSQYPTPRGLFSVIQKQRNPTWNPPDSPWAKGLGPIPPGPGNPLGTRWIGTSASAVGIHGTYASSSIGHAASHGCIRMYIRDVEWLYERINLGTPVKIV
jgi:lipoprotein-anchoring transpeptidase ErfK/SrfK